MNKPEYQHRYEEKHKHPCLDCGTLIRRRSKRCVICAGKNRSRENSPVWKGGRRQSQARFRNKTLHPCVDCEKPVIQKATRCHSCTMKEYLRHNNHPCWKGGKFKHKSGYILVSDKGHPKANKQGYILEHILVWETAHSKSLPQGWIIHHLNGIRDDNRIANLVALPEQKHRLILTAKAKRIQELEALLNGQHQLV